MNSKTRTSPPSDASTPARIDAAPRLAPTVRSSTYSRSAGSAPEFRLMTCSIISSRLTPADLSLIVDARLDGGDRRDAVIQHCREQPADVAFGDGAKAPGRVRLEREADRRAVVLVERMPRAPKIVSGERRSALDDVEGRVARLNAVRLKRQNLQVRRQRVVVSAERRFAVRERSLIDQRQPQLRR